jgi:lipopolysaccharide heptosyltransferase II
MKILILRFSSIGDIVLTSPVIRCLKKKFPDAEIHYATKKSFLPVVQHNLYLDKIHLLEDSTMSLINELRKEKFDYVVDLHNNQRTFLVKLLLGVKSSSFDKINFRKWLMVNFKINHLLRKHIVERYLDTLKSFEIENDGEGLDYFLSKDEEVDLKSLPPEFQNGYIGWVIGAKHNTKKFPTEKIVAVLSRLNCPVILLGGREDEERGEKIKSSMTNGQLAIFNACGKFSLNQSASLVKQARLIISNDTGLMHLAAAFKKPVISLWGNTIPEFGMSPYFGKNEIPNARFEAPNLNCRPCSKLGYDKCPLGHFKCMNLIEEGKVADEARSMIPI